MIDGDVAAEIRDLKQPPGKNIVQYGFGHVSRLLLEHGLLDELRLWVHPLIVGRGQPERSALRRRPGDRVRAGSTRRRSATGSSS